jgi:RNA polymerase sigma factor (sigma-70 family)
MNDKVVSSPIVQLIRRTVEDSRIRELSEEELLQRFHVHQDEAAFYTLLRRHGPMVLDVCFSVLGNDTDAEDAFQATFLILARKAGSVHNPSALGNWLHGVAYRTALKARSLAVTRQKHEARIPARLFSTPDDLSWREVRQILHEELNKLPDRYRTPLVLCYLEGVTQEVAAKRLGLAKSTLRERLDRGRELLRTKLVHRGLGSMLLVAAAWPMTTASASVSLTLMVSTTNAAKRIAGEQVSTATVISANVAQLTEGVLKNMFLNKHKMIPGALFSADMPRPQQYCASTQWATRTYREGR